MAYVDAEIASQPDCWREAASLSADAPRHLSRSVVLA